MLWNWNVMDACFLADSWHITSNRMFAGSCIGVVLLVIVLELLRRAVKEFDGYLVRRHKARHRARYRSILAIQSDHGTKEAAVARSLMCSPIPPPFRPGVLEQAARALLHMLQFAVAYFVMLLAMYYNGYIIICIFIGAFVGAFIFHWEFLTASEQKTSASEEATVCCG